MQTRNADLQPARPAAYQRTAQRTTMTMQHLAVQPPSRSDPTVGITVLALSCLVVRHYTSPHLSWWTVQGSPPPASTIANSPQLQLHLSRVSFLRGWGMLARWNCPVCATAASLRPNDNGIDGWQPATCYSPALARPAPLSLHCHRLSPLLGALQMFPEQSA